MIIMGDNDLAADQKNIITRTRECGAGLTSLRDDHLSILTNIRNEEENRRNTGKGSDKGIEERINAVTESLQLLEVRIDESGVMLSLAAHFDTLEADRSMARLEMRRVKVNSPTIVKTYVKFEWKIIYFMNLQVVSLKNKAAK